jgi:hypothetical protein
MVDVDYLRQTADGIELEALRKDRFQVRGSVQLYAKARELRRQANEIENRINSFNPVTE